MSFYTSFIQNIQHDTQHNQIQEKKYYNRYFKTYVVKFFLDKYNDNTFADDKKKLLSMITNYLKPYINKPQQLIKDEEDYYVAVDMRTNTKYICFKDLCVLDFDISEYQFKSKDEILTYLEQNDQLQEIPYMCVETRNGYHIYLMDIPREHNSIETIDFLLQFKSDIFYKFYCYLRGFSIRFNKKEANEEDLFTNIKLVNKSKKKINRKLRHLFHKQVEYIDNAKYNLSKMK